MIRARITDKEALLSISHDSIVNYLNDTGWGKSKDPRYREFEGCSVLVPDHFYRDYPARVADLIRTLSQIEERSELDVFLDLGGDLGEPA